MQKWLPLNYSFVRIQNSLTNLFRDKKFFTIFVSKTRSVRLFLILTKEKNEKITISHLVMYGVLDLLLYSLVKPRCFDSNIDDMSELECDHGLPQYKNKI